MNRIIFAILVVVLIGSKSALAQPSAPPPGSNIDFQNLFTFAWDVNIPMGDKFVDETSFAGGKLEYRKMVTHNMSLGVDLSWNSFFAYQPYTTYHLSSSSDITSDLYTYNYTLPMAITGHYYFNSNSPIFVPYVGLGLGAVYSEPKLFVNIYELYGENWGFLVRPELGTLIKFERDADVGLLVGTRYSYSTNKEDFFHIENLQSLGFQLGLVFLY